MAKYLTPVLLEELDGVDLDARYDGPFLAYGKLVALALVIVFAAFAAVGLSGFYLYHLIF